MNTRFKMIALLCGLWLAASALAESAGQGKVTQPGDEMNWPEAMVFIGDDCSVYGFPAIFPIGNKRACFECDSPRPLKIGRKLYLLRPARPGVEPRLMLDAGQGCLGSPSVSFDGKWIYISMAREGDAFYHLYRLPSSGGEPVQLTRGPYHDLDPAELPDGRLVFSSTRIGQFDEYHSAPSRALFVMNGDGAEIRPITHTPIFDDLPRVMADGRIVFIREDFFLDICKEDVSLHAIRPDGTGGETVAGVDSGPDYAPRHRNYGYGSPAPMPDGRLAFISNVGAKIIKPGAPENVVQVELSEGGNKSAMKSVTPVGAYQALPGNIGEVCALPDNRLLCTVQAEAPPAKGKPEVYDGIAVLDADHGNRMSVLYRTPGVNLHSVAFLGSMPRPRVLPAMTDPKKADNPAKTGFMYCQNVRNTRNTSADWSQVRAVRVLSGKASTLRSTAYLAVHEGVEAVELGTVPLMPDGSFFVEVPADTPVAFQMVDAEGRSEMNEMSWIYVRAGETKSCVGCHNSRQVPPDHLRRAGLALRAAPAKLLGQGKPVRFRGQNPWMGGIMDLQLERLREIASLDQHAVAGDGDPTGQHELEALHSWLKSKDPGMKISACQRLSIYHDRAAAPFLAGLLNDASREVRLAAIFALAACGTRESVGPLFEPLSDSNSLIAQAAAVALENLTGQARKFDPFAAGTDRRSQASQWKEWIQSQTWDGLERNLVAQLENADQNVTAADKRLRQRRAVVALGHIGAETGRKALLAYARSQIDMPWVQGRTLFGIYFQADSPYNPRTQREALRSLGHCRDAETTALLKEIVERNIHHRQSNLFLSETALEALGYKAGAEDAPYLVDLFGRLKEFHAYYNWYGGGHPYNEASTLHYRVLKSLDKIGATNAIAIVPAIIRSLPIDTDRQLFMDMDDYETVAGRVIRRAGAESVVVETCLGILGEPAAAPDEKVKAAVSTAYKAFGGNPLLKNRAAQVLSIVCRDRKYEPRIRATFNRYRALPRDPLRRYTPIDQPVPDRAWVLYHTARLLGELHDPASADSLISALEQDPNEAAFGRPKPDTLYVGLLQDEHTPCYRAAAARALGNLREKRAVGTLFAVLKNLDNAIDTRYAAAVALGKIGDAVAPVALADLTKDYPDVSIRNVLRAIQHDVSPEAGLARCGK